MNERSRKTLDRIKKNDSTLDHLQIGRDDVGAGDIFNSYKWDDFSKLGKSLQNNTHVDFISLRASPGLDKTNSAFYNGLKQNPSIRGLNLLCRHRNSHRNSSDGEFMWFDNEVVHEILRVYQQNNNLIHLSMYDASHILQNGGEVVLAATLRHCANLKKIYLQESNITDEQLLPMVEAMRGLRSLEYLNLSDNRIGNAGCMTLVPLLEDPDSSLSRLYLRGNEIYDEGATIIINSLANNRRLRELHICGNLITDSFLQQSFPRLLYNTSSLNSIYYSNHTLENLSYITLSTLSILEPTARSSLTLNKCTNKCIVAIIKILRYHPIIDMEQLFDWDSEDDWSLKALPYITDWFERAMKAVISARGKEWSARMTFGSREYAEVSRRKLSAIYQFAQAMPLLFAAATPFVASHAKDESSVKSRVEMESMNEVATEKCCSCVIM